MPEIKDVSKAIRHLILFDHAAKANGRNQSVLASLPQLALVA